MSTERFDCNSEMYHSHFGAFVRHDDHLAALAKLESQNAALLFRVNAFYSGNPEGGIVKRLEAALTAERERVARLQELILHETGEDEDGNMPHEPREALLILRRTALEDK